MKLFKVVFLSLACFILSGDAASLRCSGIQKGRYYCGQGIIVEGVLNNGAYKQWKTVQVSRGRNLSFRFRRNGKVQIFGLSGSGQRNKFDVSGIYDGIKIGCTKIGNSRVYDPYFVRVFGYRGNNICYNYMRDSVQSACRMIGQRTKGACRRFSSRTKTAIVDAGDESGPEEIKRQN